MTKKFAIKEAWVIDDGKKVKLHPLHMDEIGSGIPEDYSIGGYGDKEKIEELTKGLITQKDTFTRKLREDVK